MTSMRALASQACWPWRTKDDAGSVAPTLRRRDDEIDDDGRSRCCAQPSNTTSASSASISCLTSVLRTDGSISAAVPIRSPLASPLESEDGEPCRASPPTRPELSPAPAHAWCR